MKVFISGPMSGKPNDNVEAFHNAEVELKKRGYSVWNPAWQQFSDDTDFTREDIHDIDLRALEKCDAIYMLDGWEGSNGARVEYSHARALGKKIMYECLFSNNEWRNSIDAAKHRGIMRYKLRNDIQNLYAQGYSFAQMSRITGVNISTVMNIVNSIDENDKYNIAAPSWLKAVKKHDEQIDNLYNKVSDQLASEITAVDDRVASIEGEVEAIKESIGTDNLQEQLDKDFDDVYTEFQSVKDTVNDINMGYIKWSSEVSQFDERIEKLEKDNRELRDEIKLLWNNAFNGLEKRIDLFGKAREDSEKDINKRIDILNDSIRRLQEGFAEVADDTTLNTSVNEKLDEKVAKLQDDLLENTKVIADLAENNIKNRKLETRVNGIENKMSKMKDNIDAAHQNIVHQADRTNANITSLIDLESRVKSLEAKKKKSE